MGKKRQNKSNDKEYLMMRQEILQYLGEYQAVRNMMYLVTATTMGFAFSQGTLKMPFLFLIPLMVILPSYIIATDYWKCVTKASTYLIVFYEQEKDSAFHWESRSTKLGKRYSFMANMNYQHIPYYVCGGLCLILYFISCWGIRGFTNCWEIIDYVYVLIGTIVAILSVFIFIHYGKVDNMAFCREWMAVKEEEDKEK